jgi:hypothetical protein
MLETGNQLFHHSHDHTKATAYHVIDGGFYCDPYGCNRMAERVGFEPTVPGLAEHTISSRAPSANSGISPHFLLSAFSFQLLSYDIDHQMYKILLISCKVMVSC